MSTEHLSPSTPFMNNRTIIAIVVIALAALGSYFLFGSTASAPTPEPEAPQVTSPEATQGEVVVSYTNEGFSPLETNIKVGDTVRFVNNASSGLWVGADEHPTHTNYDGTSKDDHCVDGAPTGGAFDMCRQMATGESWTFTFTKAGTFDFHNHARAQHGGSVVVTN